MKLEEGGGIEPLWLITRPPGSNRIADRSAAPSITYDSIKNGPDRRYRTCPYGFSDRR